MKYIQLVLTFFFIFILKEGSIAHPLFKECMMHCLDTSIANLDLTRSDAQDICRRGCTLYNFDSCHGQIRMFPASADSTLYSCKFKCGIACVDSYLSISDSAVCRRGCDYLGDIHRKLLKPLLDRAKELEKATEKDVDPDMLSDPSIKSQLSTKTGDYKIPETRIRTMPIDKMKEDKSKDSGDWLDCASQNSGIPRSILLTAILLAVLIAVWLCFASEKKNSKEQEVDKKPILDNDIVKDPSTIEDAPMIISDHIHFLPPAYESETELKQL